MKTAAELMIENAYSSTFSCVSFLLQLFCIDVEELVFFTDYRKMVHKQYFAGESFE